MLPLLRTELLKLTTTRGPWLLAAAGTGLTVVLALQAVLGAGRRGAPSVGTAGAALAVLDALSRGALVALVLGTVQVTAEYRHRTVTATLLQAPRRWRVSAARGLAAAAAGAALAAAGGGVVAAVGTASGVLAPQLLNPDVLLRAAGLLVAYPVYAVLGVAVGELLSRSQPLAVVLPLMWVVGLEGLLTDRLPAGARAWTLGGTTAAMQNSGGLPRLLPVWLGATALTAYVAALLVAAGHRFARRNVA